MSKRDNISYYLLFGIWYSISLLPMWLLYALSSVVSTILFYVIRYRRKIVHKNLAESFPKLSKRKLWFIERRFYVHFCDILFESIKFFSISPKEMRRRFVFTNPELLEESASNGKSCGIFLGHYANWEWVSSFPLWVDPNLIKVVQLYHPLENVVFDRLIGYTRERLGSTNIPVNESLRHIVKYRKNGKPLVIGFIADQVPLYQNIHYWTTFLNHKDTPVFTGPERLMRQLDMDVYYLDVRRVKRGRYKGTFHLITDKPKEASEFSITETYTRMMEKTIMYQPSYWLWTHNRWKRTRKEWQEIQLYNEITKRKKQKIRP